jgi:hypothetical protein
VPRTTAFAPVRFMISRMSSASPIGAPSNGVATRSSRTSASRVAPSPDAVREHAVFLRHAELAERDDGDQLMLRAASRRRHMT